MDEGNREKVDRYFGTGDRSVECLNCKTVFTLHSNQPAGSWCPACEPQRSAAARARVEALYRKMELDALRNRQRCSDLWDIAWTNRQIAAI